MIYITGDIHGDVTRIGVFCDCKKLTSDDTVIILGDAGLNYLGGDNDSGKKRYIASLPITVFCIHGNHEMRPQTIDSYRETEWRGGTVFVEDKYPNLLFARDGEVYDLDGKKAIAIGGAYSVDMAYRLLKGHPWFPDEQPSDEIKARVEEKLAELSWKTDLVLSHTCPKKYTPTEAFLPGLNQLTVDRSTEEWLDRIEDGLSYERWYCGHWHIAKSVDSVRFMYEDFDVL